MPGARNTLPFGDPGLFLETTAHFDRLVGDIDLAAGVDEAIAKARRVVTSAFVIHEFEVVVATTFEKLRGAIEDSVEPPSLQRDLPVLALCRKIRRRLGPKPTGGSLVNDLLEGVANWFAHRPTTPQTVLNYLAGQQQLLRVAVQHIGAREFSESEIIPGILCCQLTGFGDLLNEPHAICDSKIGSHCPLEKVMRERWAEVHTCVTLISQRRFLAESAPLRKLLETDLFTNQPQINQVPLFLAHVAQHPNLFGDILIYLEVPPGWTLLSRDRAHKVLVSRGPRQVRLGWIRPPRLHANISCQVTHEGKTTKGTILNYSVDDLGLRVPGRIGRVGASVSLEAQILAGSQRQARIKTRRKQHANLPNEELGLRFIRSGRNQHPR